MITSLSELYFRFERFILLLQTKKWFLWAMAAPQADENHGDEWGLTKYLRWEICIQSNLNTTAKFTSSKSTKFKYILPWNISQIITKTVPISIRIVIRYAMKRVSPFEFYRKSMETKTTTWPEFPNGGKVIVEQILASKEIT